MPNFVTRGLSAVAILVALLLASAAWALQAPPPPNPIEAATKPAHSPEEISIREALLSLPIAAALGAALAFRPQRRGTPNRDAAVIQTQIILSVVGTIVMLVVGASLARAFGIVGAASLVRYRSKIEDPKDAGVMLCCLAIGLASGVGIYWVAGLSTVFVMGVLWVLESFEPEPRRDFNLKIKAADTPRLKEPIELILRKHRIRHDLRTSSPDELCFSVEIPASKKTDRITEAIQALAAGKELSVEWSDRKPPKNAAA
jgi:uncharacterized membrane protein YhiD involved in acid resistance